MTSVVALCAVTGGINLITSHAELRELGLIPGSFTILSVDRMEEIRLALENNRGNLPDPRGGGDVGGVLQQPGAGAVGGGGGVEVAVGGDEGAPVHGAAEGAEAVHCVEELVLLAGGVAADDVADEGRV